MENTEYEDIVEITLGERYSWSRAMDRRVKRLFDESKASGKPFVLDEATLQRFKAEALAEIDALKASDRLKKSRTLGTRETAGW